MIRYKNFSLACYYISQGSLDIWHCGLTNIQPGLFTAFATSTDDFSLYAPHLDKGVHAAFSVAVVASS